jgi:NAD+ kinase
MMLATASDASSCFFIVYNISLKVYMGESLSSRVSYFGLSLDGGAWTKVKSSGLCVSTGTGSTSWHLSINRITEQSVEELVKLLGTSCQDPGLVKRVTDEFNRNLMFSCGTSDLKTGFSDLYLVTEDYTSKLKHHVSTAEWSSDSCTIWKACGICEEM